MDQLPQNRESTQKTPKIHQVMRNKKNSNHQPTHTTEHNSRTNIIEFQSKTY